MLLALLAARRRPKTTPALHITSASLSGAVLSAVSTSVTAERCLSGFHGSRDARCDAIRQTDALADRDGLTIGFSYGTEVLKRDKKAEARPLYLNSSMY